MSAFIGKPRDLIPKIVPREDGRFEVTVNGYVRWCGTSRETAEMIARAIRPPDTRPLQDHQLERAIRLWPSG
jgi:hypothetical protein